MLLFSTTGTLARRACSTTNSWMRRMSGSASRYFSHGAEAVGARVPHPEVRCVRLLVLDREDAMDHERALDLREHPGNQMDALEHE